MNQVEAAVADQDLGSAQLLHHLHHHPHPGAEAVLDPYLLLVRFHHHHHHHPVKVAEAVVSPFPMATPRGKPEDPFGCSSDLAVHFHRRNQRPRP